MTISPPVQNNKGPRNVDLYFLYNERNELQNIVIRDNGKGMDLVETRAYATYCYSKRRQREDREVRLAARLEASLTCTRVAFTTVLSMWPWP